ncbi:hypothetical protein KZ483_27540 [Paenibacillus sp. sptzw28]|uniref:hypothetical protein n=1 Tax=Paenibacillus sp. sptzw28 TaxID=715179 RepID=UPI001C6EA429|nr:hypothetical protein [Paenibacillus sp. sptzw28]QYR21379.1 hypothetical protein KZ483_27540 [Paenibacillus sp. sptzw28]
MADAEPVTAAEIIPLVGGTIAKEAYDRPLEHPWDSTVDITKIRSELGYEVSNAALRFRSGRTLGSVNNHQGRIIAALFLMLEGRGFQPKKINFPLIMSEIGSCLSLYNRPAALSIVGAVYLQIK